MSIVKNSTVAKIAAIAIALAFVFSFAGVTPAHAALTEAQIQSILSLLVSFGTDQATIDNVDASLRGQPTTPVTPAPSAVCPYVWSNNLSQGSTGADVMKLQQFLNDQGSTVSATGAGSPGNETEFYGSRTGSAVIKYQEANSASILAPVGLTSGVPFFGPSTRAHANANCTVATTPPPGDGVTPPPAPVGTGLSVAGGVQPANTLAPYDAARIPFTNFTVTAGSDGDVVMNSVVVERTGLSVDANLASVVLLDSDGKQIGLTKTLNSNHQAKVGDAVTIPAGQSRTFSIGGNMAASATVKNGEILSIDVVSINTSASVTGSLPIKGAQHTVNNSLVIGTITVQRGPLDPNNAVSKEVGTTAYTFSALKITAGSSEKVRLMSIRWNQASSTSASDLDNLVSVVEGVEYPTTVSSDGKFYTSVFPGGILIDKGFSKEVSIKADIVSGSGRTVTFTIEKKTDIDIRGELYGYGITPPTSGTGITAGNIWFPASTVTVSGGTIVVTQNTGVPSQNIGINVANQTLGGIKVRVEGEAVSVASIVFDMGTSTGAMGRVTDVTIVDSNGSVVAGPVDCTAICDNNSAITFTDTITFPIGENTYTVKGKIGSKALTDSTYQLTTNPASDWTSVTGDNTGDTLTPSPSGDQAIQTMTVKAGALSISVSNTPAAQTIVAGVQGFNFANYQLDASASGEDVKMNNIPVENGDGGSGTATDLTSCQLWDGDTALNTGSNSLDPSGFSTTQTVTFDAALVIPKGTIKTLALKCNVRSGATGAHDWGYNAAASPSATGLVSGQSITVGENASTGQVITLTTGGTLTVSLDSSSPSYSVAAANTTGNTIAVYRFEAQNEAIDLRRLALQLTTNQGVTGTGMSSSTASDLVRVTVWDGSTQVGQAIWTGSNHLATSTFSTAVRIPKDGHKVLAIKADFSEIGTGKPAVQGHTVAVDYDGGDVSSTDGNGVASGSDINTDTTTDTASNGVALYKSFPTISKLSVPTNTLTAGQKSLLRWKVSADSAGDIGIANFAIDIATTSATLQSVNIYCYTDSGFSSACSGLSNDGGLLQTDLGFYGTKEYKTDPNAVRIGAQDSSGASTTIQVPAGGSRWFEVRGTVGSPSTPASITTQLEGDSDKNNLATTTAAAEAGLQGFMFYAATTSPGVVQGDFVWSPNATTTSGVATHADWTNGYGVPGLPTTNLSPEVLSI